MRSPVTHARQNQVDADALPSGVLFDAGRQLVKVRLVMWLAVACAVGGCWWGWSLSQTYGLSPGDGGVLKPLTARLTAAAIVAGLGLLFGAGIGLYARQYIAQIRTGPTPGDLVFRTPRLLGSRQSTYPAAQVRFGGRHEGRSDDAFLTGIAVHAPWRAVYVPGRRLPLILDGQGRLSSPTRSRG